MSRSLHFILWALLFGSTITPSAGADPGNRVIYANELAPGWANWSYADVVLAKDIGAEIKPIEVKGAGWSALYLHHAPFPVPPESRLTFYINGGLDGGQTICIKAELGETVFESNFCIVPRAKTWNLVSVPVEDLNIEDGMIDGIRFEASQAQAYSAYYVAQIELESAGDVPAAGMGDTSSMAIPDYHPEPLPATAAGMELSAVAVASQLTLGVNIGNTLEAPNGETSWGNPRINREYVELIKKSGFDLVRLPVAWHSHADPATAQIDPAWMDRVEEVVQLCLEQDLYIILNIHWDGGWLEENVTPGMSDLVAARQRAYWQQIATRFRDVDQRLMFASANEPRVESAEQMEILYRYHQVFVDAVRATGGRNAYRNLVVQGPVTDIEKTNQLWRNMPNDQVPGRLMMEVHFYTPYQFTLMETDEDWGNVFHYWGRQFHSPDDKKRNATWGEEDEVDRLFELMNRQFVAQGVPVILGEFGAIRREALTGAALERHLSARAHYVQTVTESALKHGLVPVIWDPDGKRGLFDRRAGTVFDTRIHQALLSGAHAEIGSR